MSGGQPAGLVERPADVDVDRFPPPTRKMPWQCERIPLESVQQVRFALRTRVICLSAGKVDGLRGIKFTSEIALMKDDPMSVECSFPSPVLRP